MNFDGLEPFEDDEQDNSWGSAEQKAALAFELYEEGEHEQALVAINEALQINPDNPRWHFNKAITLDSMEKYEQAINEFQLALEMAPDDIEILNCLGIDYTRTGQYDLAIGIFERIEKLDPSFEPSYCNRIITYTEMGDYESAEQMFYMAQQLDEACPLCFYNLGNMYFIGGNYKKAACCWKKTASIEPNHPHINYRIAQACWSCGDSTGTHHRFIEELKRNPGDEEVIFNFGLFLLHSGNIASAEEKFNRILETNPDYAAAVFYLGEIAASKGDTETAAVHYRSAIQLEPSLQGPRFRLGQIAFALKNYENAFNYLSAELQLENDKAEILDVIGTLMLQMGRSDYAMHCFLKISEIKPSSPRNYMNLAKAVAQSGEKEDSQQFIDYAVELADGDDDIISEAAALSLRLANPYKAMLVLRQGQSKRWKRFGLVAAAKIMILYQEINSRFLRKIKKAAYKIAAAFTR